MKLQAQARELAHRLLHLQVVEKAVFSSHMIGLQLRKIKMSVFSKFYQGLVIFLKIAFSSFMKTGYTKTRTLWSLTENKSFFSDRSINCSGSYYILK